MFCLRIFSFFFWKLSGGGTLPSCSFRTLPSRYFQNTLLLIVSVHSPPRPHYSGPIQWARGDVGLKPSAAARPQNYLGEDHAGAAVLKTNLCTMHSSTLIVFISTLIQLNCNLIFANSTLLYCSDYYTNSTLNTYLREAHDRAADFKVNVYTNYSSILI